MKEEKKSREKDGEEGKHNTDTQREKSEVGTYCSTTIWNKGTLGHGAKGFFQFF
jgi:hypothetical protein